MHKKNFFSVPVQKSIQYWNAKNFREFVKESERVSEGKRAREYVRERQREYVRERQRERT